MLLSKGCLHKSCTRGSSMLKGDVRASHPDFFSSLQFFLWKVSLLLLLFWLWLLFRYKALLRGEPLRAIKYSGWNSWTITACNFQLFNRSCPLITSSSFWQRWEENKTNEPTRGPADRGTDKGRRKCHTSHVHSVTREMMGHLFLACGKTHRHKHPSSWNGTEWCFCFHLAGDQYWPSQCF